MKEKLSKADLRKAMRAKVSVWCSKPQSEQLQASRQISSRLKEVLRHETGTWAGFWPLDGEPSCEFGTSHDVWADTPISWAFPVVAGSSLRFFIPQPHHKFNECFQRAAFGILEPQPSKCEEVPVVDLAGAIVPGLAFDKNGIRLGRGQGFYDQALVPFSGTKIGVAFSWQMVDRPLPAEKHDIPMDLVVTELEVIRRELNS